jgi:hypothetical protein
MQTTAALFQASARSPSSREKRERKGKERKGKERKGRKDGQGEKKKTETTFISPDDGLF